MCSLSSLSFPFFLVEMLFFSVKIFESFLVSPHYITAAVTERPALVHQLAYIAKFGGLNPRILHDLKLEILFHTIF